MTKRKIRIVVKQILIVVVVLLTFVVMFSEDSPFRRKLDVYNKPTVNEENVNVHFIDVGQGASVLIQQGEEGILIDSGEDQYSDELCDFILSSGVKQISYIIATHPHSDHIGGLDEVMESYTVSNVVLPYIEESKEPDSDVYLEFLQAAETEKSDVTYSSYGEIIRFGEDVTVEILGPVEQSSNLNNMSLVCKVIVFNTSFMIMGDAEKGEISDIYELGGNFDSDILLVPHHGSNTSVHEDFFDQVSADVAVISCGEGNSYGHPHQEVVEYYENTGCEIYRTDFEGDITVFCDAYGYVIEK